MAVEDPSLTQEEDDSPSPSDLIKVIAPAPLIANEGGVRLAVVTVPQVQKETASNTKVDKSKKNNKKSPPRPHIASSSSEENKPKKIKIRGRQISLAKQPKKQAQRRKMKESSSQQTE